MNDSRNLVNLILNVTLDLIEWNGTKTRLLLFCHSGLRAGIALELIHNVIPNLIGNLPYKKGDSRCIGNDSVNDSRSLINLILNVTLDLIGGRISAFILKPSVIPAREPESPWN